MKQIDDLAFTAFVIIVIAIFTYEKEEEPKTK